MAFKKTTNFAPVPETPDKLFLDLPRRKIPDVLPHQSDTMRAYALEALDEEDVALQLPTGSGKTLVGLLIAEWLRRKNGELVVYLCPTRQLVKQVVEQAKEKYGLDVVGFTGSARDYSNGDKAAFQNGNAIAITTYSSLFNTNSFFSNADVVIIDDAHAAEGYVSSLWSVQIRTDEPAHVALQTILKPHVEALDYVRLSGQSDTPADQAWVEKLPTPVLAKIKNEIIEALDVHLKGTDKEHSWSQIRERLHACHLYYSCSEILIRPLIAPTWTHEPFSKPRQRIYMSATLGEGGDLERLTGRKKIKRLPVAEGWNQYGVGRRFFIFPEMSLDESEATELHKRLITRAGRSLVLVPSERKRVLFEESIQDLGVPIFDAQILENSKETFVSSPNGVMLIANRYDGIDFPGDECRLLFVEGVPNAVNLQERFLMSRMSAMTLFQERVQTRILQAIGRCTRSLEDYSAVVISGDELQRYLSDPKIRKFFHPELQAEIAFGIEQSEKMTPADIEDNFDIFLKNDQEWERVNQDIVTKRKSLDQIPFPAKEELGNSVSDEIDFQDHLWQGDFEKALEAALRVLGKLTHADLRGYRALWHYLAGSVAWMSAQETDSESMAEKSRTHFTQAKGAAPNIKWLVSLGRLRLDGSGSSEPFEDIAILDQIERLENVFVQLGTIHDRKYAEWEKEVINGITSNHGFERGQMLLGRLLGFESDKEESQASPDPWWIAGDLCIVFEDYVEADASTPLSPTKARQASSHPLWIRENLDFSRGEKILPVLVAPITEVSEGAIPHIKDLSFWSSKDFRDWALAALPVIRELRASFVEPGQLEWREKAREILMRNSLDAQRIFSMLASKKAVEILKKV